MGSYSETFTVPFTFSRKRDSLSWCQYSFFSFQSLFFQSILKESDRFSNHLKCILILNMWSVIDNMLSINFRLISIQVNLHIIIKYVLGSSQLTGNIFLSFCLNLFYETELLLRSTQQLTLTEHDFGQVMDSVLLCINLHKEVGLYFPNDKTASEMLSSRSYSYQNQS